MQLHSEAQACSDCLGEDLGGPLAALVGSAGIGVAKGSLQHALLEQREALQAKVLAKALHQHPDSGARPVLMWPLLSNTSTWLADMPSCSYRSKQLMAAAPAPLTTIRMTSMDFSANSKAFNKAAAEMIAVPC